ncbi:MAG: hypothetical protein KGH98_01565 [Candidatus Micrarchaeota archaeon]|nr:hypothetical protein [Candidatus Micrarchaeota archaeon]
MALEFLDHISRIIPSIKGPGAPLSLREKMMWTGVIIVVYFLMYNTKAIGLNPVAVSAPIQQLISILFAAKTGSIITVGISPIVLSSILLQLINGSGIIKLDVNDPQQKARFQTLQKSLAITIALVESSIFVSTGYVLAASQAMVVPVILQLTLGSIFIIYLDEMMSKYGVTSGLNLFIASGVSYSIIAGTFGVLLPTAIQAVASGGATALSNAVIAFIPLFVAIAVFVFSIYIYEIKVELPLAFDQFRGVGGRLPLPLLYVSVLPVILASSLEFSLTVWLHFLSGVTGPLQSLARFVAYYPPQNQGLIGGGLAYLIAPLSPPATTYTTVGGYSTYITTLITGTSQLYMPWGGFVLVPEWIHIIIYTLVLVGLCVIFGRFWIEMTGQSPKNISEQLGDMGWQIPGFRRDPRIVENVLNKYIPTLTMVGSIFVGLLAALANISGAIGTGMGILLTVGIIYMLYQQLKTDQLYETYPLLSKITK